MAQAATAVQVKEEVPDFYSTLDRNQYGRLSSVYPGWYHSRGIEQLRDEISGMKQELEGGGVEAVYVPKLKAKLAEQEKRLDILINSFPKPTGEQRDKLGQEVKDLGAKITEAMFSTSDLKIGGDLVDPHEEYVRSETPCIKMSPYQCKMAVRMEMKFDENNRMISRKKAEEMWKICRRALGESSNTAILRPRDVHRV